MAKILKCIIWDVDDTLYDVSTGFTSYRNGPVVWQFMVDHLHFPSLEAAKEVRDLYFEKYHSTAKALTIAQQEGTFPSHSPKFQTADLSQYWAEYLDFTLLTPKTDSFLQDLQSLPLLHVAFSNGPRIYVQRVLQRLGMWGTIFTDDTLFAVDDVLPYCKPEKEAFETIFQRIKVSPEECIMVEDSMKNIRCAKQLGMKTIFVVGKGQDDKILNPSEKDPAVDAVVETVEQLKDKLGALWSDDPLKAFVV
ncbi:putative hydrolase of the HAD superfamily [Fistulifera solaris]|uniref:Putative hydrolase of the HAD superfamily n=1 Tax=Fistulifera solaris TaxID=1519565 RepID=A0A1Z5KH11_FISSO|nr:putative hydrolase of the HAD superfamily [Fistulifera solaris]|eukprot:GAX25614.1 putative hydrolase of the HAD superfamily [Fistulifera solaris]